MDFLNSALMRKSQGTFATRRIDSRRALSLIYIVSICCHNLDLDVLVSSVSILCYSAGFINYKTFIKERNVF